MYVSKLNTGSFKTNHLLIENKAIIASYQWSNVYFYKNLTNQGTEQNDRTWKEI